MKKLIFIMGIFFSSISLFAEPHLYIDTFLGINFAQSRSGTEPGLALGASLGQRVFCSPLRVEGEVSYRKNEYAIWSRGYYDPIWGAIRKVNLMGNILIDLDIPEQCFQCGDFPISPFIGFGLGYSNIHYLYTSQGYGGTFHSFAYQGIVGITVTRAFGIEGALQYRYLGNLDALDNHTLSLNLKRDF